MEEKKKGIENEVGVGKASHVLLTQGPLEIDLICSFRLLTRREGLLNE